MTIEQRRADALAVLIERAAGTGCRVEQRAHGGEAGASRDQNRRAFVMLGQAKSAVRPF